MFPLQLKVRFFISYSVNMHEAANFTIIKSGAVSITHEI
jgi:hypothetical protein